MSRYDPKEIEEKWQKRWRESALYKSLEDSGKEKSYVLDMFPYPSGEGLHVGHPKGYIATDIYSRLQRMRGKSVLHPMGWDAFGLPAENFAIKNKVHPSAAVERNIARYKEQLGMIGFDYDWSREINTIDPGYYRWTQWIFLQMFKKGLAYESNEPINWCPQCQTGLANEDVEDGQCERCNTAVEKRRMRQWVLRITDYADRMLQDLEALPWPEHIKELQRNWIGRSEGAEIIFPLSGKYKFVLLHGFNGNPSEDTYLWIKKELENRGHEVVVPELPNTSAPTEKEWVAAALGAATYDKNTIVIGHSLGAVTAMKVLEKLDTTVAGLVLFGGFCDPNFLDKARPFANTFSWKFDGGKIQKNTGRIVILHDRNDTAISRSQVEALSHLLDTPITEVVAKEPHFEASEEPVVIHAALPSIKVFTTRADTLFGATYVVLAPEHPLLGELRERISNWKEVEKYTITAQHKTEIERTADGKEKSGVELKGIKVINPATEKEIPIFVADYVLGGYGTGAIMAVPAHDERDFAFAKKFNLSIQEVITGGDIEKAAYTGPGTLINSEHFDGVSSEEARQKITRSYGEVKVSYKLRDWVFSRQRYWGEPIPLIHCDKDGWVAVPEKDLPVRLPEVDHYEPTGTGESPLSNITEWVNTRCPTCGGPGRRETNTMPQWAGSSWYYLRFMDPKDSAELVSKKNEKYWAPVDMYVGGAEHATRHLIYARFWHKFLYDIGIVTTLEPFTHLYSVGLILAEDGRKMSKRFGNVINPDDVVMRYGADAFRVYEMFMGPFENAVAWSTDSIAGARRFVERIWRLAEHMGDEDPSLEQILHQTVKKVGEDIEQFKFNTAISQMMIFLNAVEDAGSIGTKQFSIFVRLIAPFAPHLAEELWERVGEPYSVHRAPWPSFEESKLVGESVPMVVQINGRLRATINVPPKADQHEFQSLAEEAVKERLKGVHIKRVIVVPGRLVNFVVEEKS
ncbi:MAG: leucine--tRNA ligase [Patescibacteria group bacterium]|nr:leucine--tRNA ligase [Patescibacteria group bacterium]